MRWISPMLLVFGVAAVAAAEDEEHKIYTCPDATGELIYQDDPCVVPKPAKQRPAASAPAPAPPPKARAASRPVSAPPAARASAPYRFKPTITPPPLKNVPWEPTWRAFVDAMSQGDRAGAVRCLTSRALTEVGPRIQAADPDALRAMFGAFDRVVVEGDVGPYWSIRVLRAGARPKWVFFERTPRGEWKIAAI
jgi:hypothetical protein